MTRTLTTRLRGAAALVLAGTLALSAAGCAGDSGDSGGSGGSGASTSATSDTTQGQVIDITITGDEVVPNGERVEAKLGEELTLRVTADKAGEIHVHSESEQELAYSEGTTELSLELDRPGVVEVESHDLDMVIVQIEVS